MSLLIADRGRWQILRRVISEPGEPATETPVVSTRGKISTPRGIAVVDGAATETREQTLLCDLIKEDVGADCIAVAPDGTRWKVITATRRPGLGLDHTAMRITRTEAK